MSMFAPVVDWLDGLGPWGTAIKTILGILVGVFAVISSLKSIAIIPKCHAGVKERNGHPVRYRWNYRKLPRHERPYKVYHGFNLLIPWIETMRDIDMREQIREPERVECTVSGYRTVRVKLTMTLRVVDTIRYLYEHADPFTEVENQMLGRVCDLLSDETVEINKHFSASLIDFLKPIADRYGIEIKHVTCVESTLDSQMAVAEATNNIADTLRQKAPIVRRADLFSRAVSDQTE